MPAEALKTKDEVGEVLDAISVKSIRPFGRTLFVKTLPVEAKSPGGLIILPQNTRGFYDGPAHLRVLRGLVLAAGPKCVDAAVGETIIFHRMHFARWVELDPPDHSGGTNLWEREGRSFVGWIDELNIAGIDEDA